MGRTGIVRNRLGRAAAEGQRETAGARRRAGTGELLDFRHSLEQSQHTQPAGGSHSRGSMGHRLMDKAAASSRSRRSRRRRRTRRPSTHPIGCMWFDTCTASHLCYRHGKMILTIARSTYNLAAASSEAQSPWPLQLLGHSTASMLSPPDVS